MHHPFRQKCLNCFYWIDQIKNPYLSFFHKIDPIQLDTYNYNLILPKGSSLEGG